jgi:PilZ domain
MVGAAAFERGLSMEYQAPERRRFPRVDTPSGAVVIRPVSMAVQMLDLSSGGLLLACPQPAGVGATLRVTSNIAGQLMAADLDVRHASSQWDPQIKGYRVGGQFVSLDHKTRSVIDDVIGGAGV